MIWLTLAWFMQQKTLNMALQIYTETYIRWRDQPLKREGYTDTYAYIYIYPLRQRHSKKHGQISSCSHVEDVRNVWSILKQLKYFACLGNIWTQIPCQLWTSLIVQTAIFQPHWVNVGYPILSSHVNYLEVTMGKWYVNVILIDFLTIVSGRWSYLALQTRYSEI